MRFSFGERGAWFALAACAWGCTHQGSVPSAAPAAPPAELSVRRPFALPASASPSSRELDAASPAGAAGSQSAAEPRSAAERGWLGVELSKQATSEPGVLVRDVVRGSPAANAGMTSGDAILSVDGQNVAEPDDVSRLVAVRGAGQRLRLGLLHAHDMRLLAIDLERFPNTEEIARRQYVGLQAPEFEQLEATQGSIEPRLASLRGKVVVIEFWASWCGPCHLLSPVLESWHERFTAQGVVVAGVSAEPLTVVASATNQMGIGYPTFADPTGATTKAYRALALPTLFVLDRGGRVRDVMVGYSSLGLSRLEGLIKQLIEEP